MRPDPGDVLALLSERLRRGMVASWTLSEQERELIEELPHLSRVVGNDGLVWLTRSEDGLSEEE